MSVGHGQLGLLDRLRDFDELLQDSGGDRRPYLELQLGVVVTGWSLHSGSVYKATFLSSDFIFMGVLRDAVSVETMVEPRPLARAETTSLAAGEFYADIDSWTETGTIESNGGPTIYVRLPDSGDPANTTVVAMLLFTFGTKGEVHPWLGPEKLLNGGFESWASATDANDWTETPFGSGTSIDREAVIVRSGSFSARLSHVASPDGAIDDLAQTRTFVPGKFYRLAGYYQTDAPQPAGFIANLRVSDTADGFVVQPDGRSYIDGTISVPSDEPVLWPTIGAWRRALLDFLAKGTSMSVGWRFMNSTGGAATGYLYLDAWTLSRIYRWCFHDARLAAGSIPEVQIASQSIIFRGKTIGIGGITLINGDGQLAKALAGLLSMNKPAQVLVGGAFANGEEVYRDNWMPFFPGRTQQPDVTDAEVKWDLEDSRTLTKVNAPLDKYKLATFPNMYLNQEGYARPYLFGRTRDTLIKPTRTGFSSEPDYGKYEFYDNMIQPGREAGQLRVFPNEEMATRNLLGVTISSVSDFTFSGSTFSVLRDVRNYRFDRGGNDVGTGASFDFFDGTAVRVANIDVVGPAYQVAADLQAAMRTAIGGGDTTTLVTYSETTHLWRVRRTSGTLDLLPKTGVNAHKKSWQILGFDTGSDKITANDYTGEEVTFTGPDEDHVLRMQDASGYQDDSDGTILGDPSEDLDTPAAVASWLLQRVAMIPRAKVDIPGFKTAHDAQRAADVRLRAFLHSPEDLSGILANLEQAGLMDLVVDGASVWHCNRYATGSVGALELFDRDYLSWQMYLDARSIYRMVRILYGYDPQLAKWAKSKDVVVDAGVPVKHGSDEILEVASYFDDDAGVIATAAGVLGQQLQRLSAKVPRIAAFSVAGRLPSKLPGDKVVLTRTGPGVLDATGTLAAVVFRILSLSHNPLSGISRCVACEDVTFLS